MEFEDIDNLQDIESYLNRGYSIINNLTSFPIRLWPFEADLYAQKWAAVKGGEDYLLALSNKGSISFSRSTIESPAPEVSETSKSKKKPKEINDEDAVIVSEPSQLIDSPEALDEIKDLEVQESGQ